MTLASRKPPNQNQNTEEANETKTETEPDQNLNKKPWWQNLPSKKNQKNKVILEEYDKLKSSLPEWPWMAALKNEKQSNSPLTRKTVKDTVRVVMTSTASTEQPPLTSTSQMTTKTTSTDPTTTVTETESKD